MGPDDCPSLTFHKYVSKTTSPIRTKILFEASVGLGIDDTNLIPPWLDMLQASAIGRWAGRMY